MGASFPTARGGNRHLLSVARIPAYWSIDTARIERYNPFHKGKIALGYFVPLHSLCQSRLGTGIFSYNDQPRCILIKTMNDAWAHIAFNVLQIWVVGQQCIDQRIIGMTWCRMNDHPRCFIDHQQIAIFIDNIERQSLWLEIARLRLQCIQNYMYFIAGSESIAWLASMPVD